MYNTHVHPCCSWYWNRVDVMLRHILWHITLPCGLEPVMAFPMLCGPVSRWYRLLANLSYPLICVSSMVYGVHDISCQLWDKAMKLVSKRCNMPSKTLQTKLGKL